MNASGSLKSIKVGAFQRKAFKAMLLRVHLDHDGELGPMHGVSGTMDAELEVQRTKVVGTTKVHVDNEGVTDGLWRGEMKCIGPKAEAADLWMKNLGRIALLDVERNFDGSGTRHSASHKRS